MAGVNLDITDQKKMELELRRYQDDLELMVQERTEELSRANEDLQIEVTRRKRYEEALRDASKKILQESTRRRFLSGRLVNTLERDRRDMAMYLHDQVGQTLVSLKMDLEMAERNPDGSGGTSGEKLKKAGDMVMLLMDQIKDLSRNLRTDILDSMGLIPALRSLVETMETQFGLQIHFYYKEPPLEIDPGKSLSLYRIAQEALTNVGKHGQATNVFVNLIMKYNTVQLNVEDDGVGFDYDEIMNNSGDEGSLGIMIMRERAVLAGGELIVESVSGKGTNVIVEIPVG